MFEIALNMCRGEIEYRKKEYEKAFSYLKKSVYLYDGLVYDEPWGWMQPTRHALGALLLEQGHVDESMSVYKEDLDIYPNNIWSLKGYYECFRRKGEELVAEEVLSKIKYAEEDVTEEISFSCLCRKY